MLLGQYASWLAHFMNIFNGVEENQHVWKRIRQSRARRNPKAWKRHWQCRKCGLRVHDARPAKNFAHLDRESLRLLTCDEIVLKNVLCS